MELPPRQMQSHDMVHQKSRKSHDHIPLASDLKSPQVFLASSRNKLHQMGYSAY